MKWNEQIRLPSYASCNNEWQNEIEIFSMAKNIEPTTTLSNAIWPMFVNANFPCYH